MKDLNQGPLGDIAAIYADLNQHLTRLNMVPSAGRSIVNRGGAADRAARPPASAAAATDQRRSRRDGDVQARCTGAARRPRRRQRAVLRCAVAPGGMPAGCRPAGWRRRWEPHAGEAELPNIGVPSSGGPARSRRCARRHRAMSRCADHLDGRPARRPDPPAGRPDRLRVGGAAVDFSGTPQGLPQRTARPAGIAATARRRTSSNR